MSREKAQGDADQTIEGATSYLFSIDEDVFRSLASEPRFPIEYKSYGTVGPDNMHFKNIVVSPQLGDGDKGKVLMLMGRRFPDIQTYPVPVDLLDLLGSNEAARSLFWGCLLSRHARERLTALRPRLTHEGYKNNFSQKRHGGRTGAGQVAPGLHPLPVTFEKDGVERRGWLLIYNSVPDYRNKKNDDAVGRVINAALLEYDDPCRIVARGPLPLILPRRDSEVPPAEGGLTVRTSNVAFAGGGGIDENGGLYVFYTEGDTLLRCARWDSADNLIQALLRFDRSGRLIIPGSKRRQRT